MHSFKKRSETREVERERLKKWRAEHPELLGEQQRRANLARKLKYPEQREAIQARLRQKRIDDPERVRAYDRKTYLKHREKILARTKKYAKENPHIVAATQAKIRAIKMRAPLGDLSTIAKWQSLIRAMRWIRCHWCGTKVSGRKIHFDHVMALSNGGAHSIDNLCASCPECNLRKNARAIADWVVGDQTFLNL